MNRIISLIIIFLLSFGICAGAFETPELIEIYVATDGDNSAAGTIEAPLATFQGARERVESLKKEFPGVPITVNFRGGEYFASETVNFTAKDSGTEEAVITYRAYNNEQVKFVGYKQLDAEGFVKVTDKEVLKAMLPEGRKNAGVLDLKSCGIESIHEYLPQKGFGSDNVTVNATLYLNGNEQTLAQWPNGRNEYADVVKGVEKRAFVHNEERSSRWLTATEPMISGYLSYEYAHERLKIQDIDVATKTIDIKDSYNIKENGYWQIINLLEELDSPGEYYIDRENLLLYYYPPYSMKGADLKLAVFDKPYFIADGLSYVNFENMYFGDTCKSIFEIKNSNNLTFTGCDFENVGTECIKTENCSYILVDTCNFVHIGGTCIEFNGGERLSLTPAENKAVNCEFYDWGTVKRTYSYAVDLLGVGSHVENSIMHQSPHTAVHFDGNDHTIRNNEIFNVVKETADSGAIYAGGSWAERGNVIENNYFHRVQNNRGDTRYFAAGIYLDDCFCGTTIRNNVLRDINQGIIVGGGRDNFVEGNIIMDSKDISKLDARGETWSLDRTSPGGTYYYSLTQVPYDQEPWTKYPGMAETLDGELHAPVGNIYSNNLLINNTNELLGANVAKSFIEYARSFENNYEVKAAQEAGAIFKDAENEDYTILPDSPILKTSPVLGEINFDNIGLDLNEYRTSLTQELSDFRLIAPRNNVENVRNEGVVFSWEACRGADGYILTVARDAEFEDILIEKEIRDTYYITDEIVSGLIGYYWKVEAFSESRQFKLTKLNSGGPRYFTSAKYSILHKENLQTLTDRAQRLYDMIVEGDEPGQFAPGSKAKLEKPLRTAQEALLIEEGYQETLDSAEIELDAVTDEVMSTMKIGYRNIDYMLENKKDWVGEGTIKIEDGQLIHSSPEKLKVISYKKECAPKAEILCFNTNMFSTNYVGIGIHANPGQPVYSFERMGYLVVMKDTQLELQRYHNAPSEFLSVVYNSYFKLGEDNECQFGVIDLGAAVRLIFTVNGVTVFDYIDKEKPVFKDFYFSMYNGGNAALNDSKPWLGYLKAAASVPEGLFGTEGSGTTGVKYADINAILESMSETEKTEKGYMISSKTAVSTQEISSGEIISLEAQMSASGTKAITFRQENEVNVLDGGNGYALIFKNGKQMLVKRKNGMLQYLYIADRDIDMTKPVKVEISTKTTSTGEEFTIKLNGEKVMNCTDSFAGKSKGYVGVYNDSDSEITILTSGNEV